MSPKELTTEEFLKLVFDFNVEEDWLFLGDRPAILDFYAKWCAPCAQTAPLFELLAQEYAGKIDFYKVNVDEEKEIADAFGVRSLPTFMFIPTTGIPMVQPGALPLSVFQKVITERLLDK